MRKKKLQIGFLTIGLISLALYVARMIIPSVSLAVDQSHGITEFVISKRGVNGLLNMKVIRYEPRELLWYINLNYYRDSRLRYGDVPQGFTTFNGATNIAKQKYPANDKEPQSLAPDSKFLVVIVCQHDAFFAPSVTSFLFVLTTDSTGRVVSVEKVDRNKPFDFPDIEEHAE